MVPPLQPSLLLVLLELVVVVVVVSRQPLTIVMAVEAELSTLGVCCHQTAVGLLAVRRAGDPGDPGAPEGDGGMDTELERERGDDGIDEEEHSGDLALPRCSRLCAAGGGALEKLVRPVSSSLSNASCARVGVGLRADGPAYFNLFSAKWSI